MSQHDPLAPFRKGAAQAVKDGQKSEPMTEHEALGKAIEALNAVPNYRIKTATHHTTYDLIPDLQAAYDQGAKDEQLREAAPELLEALKERVIAEEKEAREAGETNTPWLDTARAAIAKVMPEKDEQLREAAPQMYKALTALVENLDPYQTSQGPLIVNARAALAQAQQEQQPEPMTGAERDEAGERGFKLLDEARAAIAKAGLELATSGQPPEPERGRTIERDER